MYRVGFVRADIHHGQLLPQRLDRPGRPINRFGTLVAVVIAVAALFVVSACSSAPAPVIDSSTAGSERYIGEESETQPAVVEPTIEEPTVVPVSDIVQELVPVVISERDHDRDAFTQGLEFVDGRLFESTGSPGQFVNSTTTIREVDPLTGEVLRERDFGTEYFGEGLTLVGAQLIQLSWLNQTAYVFDRETFESIGEFSYETQGWGLCYDGAELVMSDGSGTLSFRDPMTFEINRTVVVLRNGVEVSQLNELECVDGAVWANVWQTTEIMRIDPTSGAVTGVVDASELSAPHVAENLDFVLNGIAYDRQTGTFIITGKNWSKMYEVNFELAG